MLHPAEMVPNLTVETLSHGRFDLREHAGTNGTLLIFYRGLHCPLCIRQMSELDAKLGLFDDMGVETIMLSGDDQARAQETADKAQIENTKVGYGMSLAAARDDWGLHLSSARTGSTEAAYFFEPGHFYIAPNQTLYFGWVQTSPFARPQIDDLHNAIKFALEKSYPPRGMFRGRLPEDN